MSLEFLTKLLKKVWIFEFFFWRKISQKNLQKTVFSNKMDYFLSEKMMENWLEKGFKIGEKVMFFVYKNWIYKVNGVVKLMEKYVKSIQETYEKNDKRWSFDERELNIESRIDGRLREERKFWLLKMRNKERKW